MNNKGADQTVRMCRLIGTVIVCIWHKQFFSWRGSFNRYKQGVICLNSQSDVYFHWNQFYLSHIFSAGMARSTLHNLSYLQSVVEAESDTAGQTV